MDFVDWRKSPEKLKGASEAAQQVAKRYHGRKLSGYIEELLHEAQERGEFDNLPGTGKPLKLEDMSAAGDNALAYHLLKSNDFALPEIELMKEIDVERKRAEAKLTGLIHQSKTLRRRRFPPSEREKRAFNAAVEKAAQAYEQKLREINSSILSLNISTPAILHRPPLDIEQLVAQFRASCPLL